MSASESFDPAVEVYNRAYDESWNLNGNKRGSAMRAGINAVGKWSRIKALRDAIESLERFAGSQENSKHIQHLRDMISAEETKNAL